jgi:hypothetical protein
MQKVRKTPPECAECRAKFNEVLAVGGATGHTVGEILLCTRCGEVNIFDDKLSLRSATEEDLREFETVYPIFYQDLIFRQAIIRSAKQQK